jgi:hypothetical protein
MPVPADLTLLILRLIQGAPKPPVKEWFLFPAFIELTQEEARERFEAARKPIVVAPLLEAGCIGEWTLTDLSGAARVHAERELANRNAYFEAKLREMWPEGIDAIRLKEADADLRLDLASFRVWARDYYIAVGHGLERDLDPRVARLTIRPTGGGRRPIGLPEEQRDLGAAS